MKKIFMIMIIALHLLNCTKSKQLKPEDALVGTWDAIEESTIGGLYIFRDKSEVTYRKDGTLYENTTTWLLDKETKDNVVTIKGTGTGKWIIKNNKLKIIYSHSTISSFSSSNPDFTRDMFEQETKNILNRALYYAILRYSARHFKIQAQDDKSVIEMKRIPKANLNEGCNEKGD